MYKYITSDDVKDIIFSLDLFDDKTLSDDRKIKILYALSNNIENNYREFKVKKKSGKVRVLAEPSPTLKMIQRNILKNYLYTIEPSSYVTSYIKGKSLKDNACGHVGAKMVLKLDIHGFFDHVDFLLIYKTVFGLDRFPRSVGVLLTQLVTYYGALPQGAPTSAYISNLVLRDFDLMIGTWAKSKNIVYTRYSDDMTFSGDFNPSEVIRKVRSELRKYSLELNEEKTRVINRSRRQSVTGIVVNDKLQVSREYRKKIRQEVHYIKAFGLDSHLARIKEKDKRKYLMSLYGKILFVLSVDRENKEFLEYRDFLLKKMYDKGSDMDGIS